MASAQLMTCFSLVTMAAACSFNASSPNFGDGNELMLAAKCNDVTAAKRLIVTSNINEVNAAGSTALHFAAFYDSVGVAEILLDKEADVNLKNNIGWSALIYAAKYGHTKIGTLLLENKADLNLQNKEGWSALMEAARYGHTKIGTMLVDNKADLNLQDKDGWTALMDAARYGHTDMGTLLVENKADLNLQSKDGWNALMLAVMKGHTDMGTLLVENKADLNLQNKDGLSALMLAAMKGHTDMGTLLVENKAEVNLQSKDGWTALIFAARYGHTDMGKLLVENKADLNLQTKHGGLKWIFSAAQKRVQNKAESNLQSEDGWTALIFAARYGHTEIGKLLVENKADLNLQSKDGWSALMETASEGHIDMGKLLVENKADLNLQSKDGWNALMLAVRYGHTDMGTLLVENKADLNLQDKDGWNALMFAASRGHIKIGTLLVENKADVNTAMASGGTALQVAVERGHLKMAKVLVKHGADVNAQNLAGKTPLMLAAQKGDKDIVKWLIDKEASVFPISRAGATAQQIASASDSDDQKLQKELKRTSEKTLTSQLQSPSLMQKLHYMVFDTFCLPYLLVGICVGGIVGGWLPRANASEQDPFRDGSEYLALQALAAKEPWMNRYLQLLRVLEVFSQILLPFAVVMLFIEVKMMALFFVLTYVLPVLFFTGYHELWQKPLLLPVQMIFTQRGNRRFRMFQVLRTGILLVATFELAMWLPDCDDAVDYLLGKKNLNPKGPTAWLLAESPWPLLNPAAAQLACPDVSMLPQDSKDLLIWYMRIIFVLSSYWVLATCLDLDCAFSHPPLEDDHSFDRDFTDKILETRSPEEVKNLKFEKFEGRLDVQPLKALKFFLPSGLYFDMLLGCADFFLDVLQLCTWMNAFQFQFSGCMACIMSLSLVLQIRERKGYSMEDLEEACEASLQRGILRADLFKVLQIEQCVEAPLSLCLTSYAWIFGISSSSWWALILISLPSQALSIKSLAGFVHVNLDWPDLKHRRHASNASYLVLEQRAP